MMDEAGARAHLKGAVEALLFTSERPVTPAQLRDAIPGSSPTDIREAVAALMRDYGGGARGMVILEIAGGYQMLSSPRYADYLRNFYRTRIKDRLSRPSLETLAIIAYKQPVSRSDIELIRGVNSDGVVAHLLHRGLIRIVGQKDAPGRPHLYGTDKLFLEYFGLKDLKDLPRLDQFQQWARENSGAGEAPSDGEAGGTTDQEGASEDPEKIPDASEIPGDLQESVCP